MGKFHFRRKTFNRRNYVRGIRELIKEEKCAGVSLPVMQRARLWCAGFNSSAYHLYGFDKKEKNGYLSDVAHWLFEPAVNADKEVFSNKILFRAVFGSLINIPENICLINDGRFVPLPGASFEVVSLDSLFVAIDHYGGVVLKPCRGLGGNGVFCIGKAATSTFIVNGKECWHTEVAALVSERVGYILTPYVSQGDYSARIFDGSVNTVRVNILTNPDSGRAFVSGAFHRFGTARSVPVDSWSAGGLLAPINVEDGTLGKAVYKPSKGRVEWMDMHPDTGRRISGLEIPNWSLITASLLSATEAYHGISMCAWDVVARKADFVVLEGNNFPSARALQLERGLLLDERTKRFYEFHEVI